MKKLILAGAMVLAMTAFAAPAMAADNVNSEAAFDQALERGDSVINLSGSFTINDTSVISSGVTINGHNNTITYNDNAQGFALSITTNDAVVINDLDINATFTGGRGIQMACDVPHLTVNNSLLNVNNRGIGFWDNGTNPGATVTLDNTTIQNSQKPADESYDEWALTVDTRGISFWNNPGIEVNIENNSEILGFAYCLNFTGDKDSNTNTVNFADAEINIDESKIYGWSALNIWTSNTNFDIRDSHLRGINLATGRTQSFATIVVNDDIYNQFDQYHADNCFFEIRNTTIDNFVPTEKLEQQLEEVGYTTDEYLFRVDSEGVTRAELRNVVMVDNSNNLPCAFINGNGVFSKEFYDYVSNEDNSGRFDWRTEYNGTYGNGEKLPIAVW